MNRHATLAAVLLTSAFLATAAAAKSSAGSADKLPVAVSIAPQGDFVTRIGGPHVEVRVLVAAGQSPHTYEPTPRQLEYLSRAKVYFAVGIDFEEALLPRVRKMFPELKIVDTRAGVPLRYLTPAELAREHAGHEHGEAEHATTQPAGRPDPHIWMNPLLVKIQAQTICEALVAADAVHADDYRANLKRFHDDLDRVHAQLVEALAPLKGREIFVFHPAFGYFTDAYGLRQVPVEVEGNEPSARQIATLIERAKAANVKVIFVQPQFSTKTAQTIARAIGGAVVPMDDLPQDYLKNLEDMAAKIKAALAPEKK
jgi:zinc transport system substrate-binding protein